MAAMLRSTVLDLDPANDADSRSRDNNSRANIDFSRLSLPMSLGVVLGVYYIPASDNNNNHRSGAGSQSAGQTPAVSGGGVSAAALAPTPDPASGSTGGADSLAIVPGSSGSTAPSALTAPQFFASTAPPLSNPDGGDVSSFTPLALGGSGDPALQDALQSAIGALADAPEPGTLVVLPLLAGMLGLAIRRRAA
jgi:hypothetical protein